MTRHAPSAGADPTCIGSAMQSAIRALRRDRGTTVYMRMRVRARAHSLRACRGVHRNGKVARARWHRTDACIAGRVACVCVCICVHRSPPRTRDDVAFLVRSLRPATVVDGPGIRAGVRDQPTPRNRTTRIATTDGQPVEKDVATPVTPVQETMMPASIRRVSPVCDAACAAARKPPPTRPGRYRSRSIPWRSGSR